jgi:hypothetical protein
MDLLARIPARNAFISGTIAGVATALTAALCARRYGITSVAPINAVSHVLWGDEARAQDTLSVKYTGTGFVTNHAACIFWAAIYEALFGSDARRGEAGKALLGAALVTGAAYVTDYHLVPKRLTPGYELRLRGGALAAIYGALAAALPLRGLLRVALCRAPAERGLRVRSDCP